MSANGLLDLPVVDALDLDEARRSVLRPGAKLEDREGVERRLPRYFYEVDAWQRARDTPVSEHFTLHEFMAVDVREDPAVRRWPRYVPCAVTLLAAHLELLRKAVGTLVWVAANGGYRSPGHGLVDHASPHCWGTAANIYRIGDEYLDSQEKIERFAKVATRVAPAVWVRPFGHEQGHADDHLHIDVGYARLTPRVSMKITGADLKAGKAGGFDGAAPARPLALAAVGMEAEFALFIDDEAVRPEDVFGDPTAFLRGPLMHRTGTSYHLPTGGVVYFDTGVIELATPVIELERGCAARAGRSLWESLRFVRQELNAWEEESGHRARLVGFSTHYNVSFELARSGGGQGRSVDDLALLLAHILPVPVMLLATNRRSTGVGVRPRGDRVEITVDFTPSAALMVATGTLITGVVRDVMTWPSFDLDELARRRIPVIAGYEPMPHTSRKGWLARWDCYPANPFQADIDGDLWGTSVGEDLSLRAVGSRITRSFWRSIRRLSDPFSFRLIESVMRGRAPSLLDLDDRPPEYEDVGRLCAWDDLFPPSELRRSRYERVLIHAIAGRRLHLHGHDYTPIGMRGWSQVVFRKDGERGHRLFSIDYLLGHLDDWEEKRPPPRGGRRRRKEKG